MEIDIDGFHPGVIVIAMYGIGDAENRTGIVAQNMDVTEGLC